MLFALHLAVTAFPVDPFSKSNEEANIKSQTKLDTRCTALNTFNSFDYRETDSISFAKHFDRCRVGPTVPILSKL